LGIAARYGGASAWHRDVSVSDVEGSTRLLTRLRDRYAEVLGEHQRLLRAAFDEHDGREVHAEGDVFFVAFARASDAIAAAVSAQRSLASQRWPEGVDEHPRVVALKDLGEHRLKDLDRPEHLFQFVVGDLRAEFPPLVSLSPGPGGAFENRWKAGRRGLRMNADIELWTTS
jgi:class 3 adenylate cyclase